MEIHLDLVGGLAGDMFIAALIDAFPHHEGSVRTAIGQLGSFCRVTVAVEEHRDAVLRGKRFGVRPARVGDSGTRHITASTAGSEVPHSHTSWQSIHAALDSSVLSDAVRRHAVGIFSLLADAEAAVHGTDIDAVTFHEVGAWDSIADIVGAAALIDAVQATSWSASPVPLGSGRVRTAHGILPVPAPAAARLLLGLPTLQDGIPGERVTPTGAAILRYLCPPGPHSAGYLPRPRTLNATGVGFGTRKLPGLSNHVRVLCFDTLEPRTAGNRQVHVLEFEVDDQSAEDLATGLDRLRSHAGVLDVTQTPALGKKGRIMTAVRVLVRPCDLDGAIDACFRETTTIGLRHRLVDGVTLQRHMQAIEIDGHALRVKVVERPGGRTAKAESDDVLLHQDHFARASLRRRAELAALAAPRIDVDA